MKNGEKRISRFLSLVLRHRPERIGIRLDEGGWVAVEELLQTCRQHGVPLDRATLEHLVETNDKRRFSFSEDGSRIRANQGHSIPVDLGLEPLKPPKWLYHGTGRKFLSSIEKQGLVKRSRHHVHLSGDPKTAFRVGQRHGKAVVFRVRAGEMDHDGYRFYRSANGVWLTDSVPVEYLVKEDDVT
ncbi:RNA 2'-phosphotransferase [Desmospora profundinema]|uniref:Probable RNA 2'-phosphotransferase n=1 Tax=Desmospora profundinema TaxID=1571184 RepID=A0ABU1IJS1_9BACL|nr:RNA 2'-phosphotransferase [Desmospora profundinema]MDR6224628.1 putative RNA 2'-phosphotransferase [Desmospora profundinema]